MLAICQIYEVILKILLHTTGDIADKYTLHKSDTSMLIEKQLSVALAAGRCFV